MILRCVWGILSPSDTLPFSTMETQSHQKSETRGFNDVSGKLLICREAFGLCWLLIAINAYQGLTTGDLMQMRNRTLLAKCIQRN